MEFEVVNQKNKADYDNFVKNHARGNFLQSWQWGQWQESQQKKVLRFFIYENEEVVCAAQGILQSSLFGNYWYFPYGPLWNNDLENIKIEEVLKIILKNLLTSNILFVKLEPVQTYNFFKLNGISSAPIQPKETLILNIKESEEKLLENFHNKTRYNIKLAKKHDVKVQTFTNVNEEVVSLIMQTSDRQNYRNHTKEYIFKLWEFFTNLSDANFSTVAYLANIDGKAAASGLMIDYGKTRMYLFGGSNYELRKFMAPYLMHWQAITDAKKMGLEFYDFGAATTASGHSGGYAKFKLGFNPSIINFPGSYDFTNKKFKYKLFQTLRYINRIRLHIFKT